MNDFVDGFLTILIMVYMFTAIAIAGAGICAAMTWPIWIWFFI